MFSVIAPHTLADIQALLKMLISVKKDLLWKLPSLPQNPLRAPTSYLPILHVHYRHQPPRKCLSMSGYPVSGHPM
jgi:hypothetical protein